MCWPRIARRMQHSMSIKQGRTLKSVLGVPDTWSLPNRCRAEHRMTRGGLSEPACCYCLAYEDMTAHSLLPGIDLQQSLAVMRAAHLPPDQLQLLEPVPPDKCCLATRSTMHAALCSTSRQVKALRWHATYVCAAELGVQKHRFVVHLEAGWSARCMHRSPRPMRSTHSFASVPSSD